MTLNGKKNVVSSLNAAITGGIGVSFSISNSGLPFYDLSRDLMFSRLF
jgi:hypothetical protein